MGKRYNAIAARQRILERRCNVHGLGLQDLAIVIHRHLCSILGFNVHHCSHALSLCRPKITHSEYLWARDTFRRAASERHVVFNEFNIEDSMCRPHLTSEQLDAELEFNLSAIDLDDDDSALSSTMDTRTPLFLQWLVAPPALPVPCGAVPYVFTSELAHPGPSYCQEDVSCQPR